MRSTRSAKQVALKRLSSSFDKSDTSDNSDNSDNPAEEMKMFKEEDIVLVEYDEPCLKQASSKKGRKAKGSKGGKQFYKIQASKKISMRMKWPKQ